MSNKEIQNGSKLKLHSNIILEENNILKNWKLMYLDSAMLSASQIKSIEFQIENKEEKINKFDLLKMLNKEGLNGFDIHTFLLTLKAMIRI